MSKRLQVLLDETEWREVRRSARAERLTVAAWVRRALREARAAQPVYPAERKLRAVRDALRHQYPAGRIEDMLAEIERAYVGEGP